MSNILYETPTPSMLPPKRHILNCLVQNEPGVLSRLSGILAARGFNIDSLVVCNTEVEDLSRMTIVLTGQDGVVEQARRQLEDLVPVWAVLDYSEAALVQRELLLCKINILGPEYFEELLAHHREMTAGEPPSDGAPEMVDRQTKSLEELAKDFHPSKLAASEALRHKHEHLRSITYFTHQFGGKVLDISTISCIVELYVTAGRWWQIFLWSSPVLTSFGQVCKAVEDRLLPQTTRPFRHSRVGSNRPDGSSAVASAQRYGGAGGQGGGRGCRRQSAAPGLSCRVTPSGGEWTRLDRWSGAEKRDADTVNKLICKRSQKKTSTSSAQAIAETQSAPGADRRSW